MTKHNTAILAFALLASSVTPLLGQSGSRPTPIAPSLNSSSSVLEADLLVPGQDALTGDLSSELEDLSLGDDVIGEDYFQENADGIVSDHSSSGRNRVFGIGIPSLSRQNFNDSRPFPGGRFSGDVTLEDRSGLDLYMTTRYGQGRGWEIRYLGLFEGSASDSETFFPSGGTAQLTRNGDIHNVELNYLRQAKGPLSNFGLSLDEVIYGLRYFQFNDSLAFGSNFAPNFDLSARNSLFGFQIGRRVEKQFSHRFGFAGLGKIGIYNNRLNSEFTDSSGVTFGDTQDDLSFLGELDLALTYTFRPNVRAKLGYRMLAANELGIAERQATVELLPTQTTDTDGDLFLQGGYIGLEFVR